MSYQINDQYHMLLITLQTRITDSSNLYLKVWTSSNHSSTPSQTYVTTNPRQAGSDWFYDFHVYNNDFDDGDVLDKFVIEYTGSQLNGVKLWNTNDGVTFLVDGENEKEIHSDDTILDNNKYYGYIKERFNTEGSHSIQAVYSGSRSTKLSYTPLENFIVKDTSSGGSTPAPIKGGYKLVFENPSVLKNLKYNDKQKIYFKLTQNGQPSAGKTVEVMTPKGGNYTQVTNAKGLVVLPNSGFYAGKYVVGAFFIENQRVRAKVNHEINIKKGNATITFSHKPLYNSKGVYQKKHRVYCRLTNHMSKPMKGARLSFYHNNQLKQIKTNDNGYVSMDVGAGSHTFNAVYTGSKNYNKASKKIRVLVSKKDPNG